MYVFKPLGKRIRYIYDDDLNEAFYFLPDICGALKLSRQEVFKHVTWGHSQHFYFLDNNGEQDVTELVSQTALDSIINASTNPEVKAYPYWRYDTRQHVTLRRRRKKPQR